MAEASAHPDGRVQLLQHVGVKKYCVTVVGLESHHGHLHLVGLEQDVNREVHQEIELLVVQTGKDGESFVFFCFFLLRKAISFSTSPSYLSSAS